MYNLLIVDDEQIAVEALMQGVDWHSCSIANVFSANNADEALAVLENNKIHIIICDIRMPKVSGIELMNIVFEKYSGTRFIFLTAYDSFEYAQKSIELKCYKYLLKPANYDVIREVVKELVLEVQKAEANAYYKREYRKYLNLWHEYIPTVRIKFWQELISGRLNVTESNLTRTAKSVLVK